MSALPASAIRRACSAACRGAVASVAAAAVTSGCSLLTPPAEYAPAPPAAAAITQPAAAPPNTMELRAWARELAREHCGACHIRSLPTAKSAALAIHDLDAPDWPATLTPERLRAGFTRRLNAKLDDVGKQRLRDFVETEIAARQK